MTPTPGWGEAALVALALSLAATAVPVMAWLARRCWTGRFAPEDECGPTVAAVLNNVLAFAIVPGMGSYLLLGAMFWAELMVRVPPLLRWAWGP
jgi:hypothetical protein